ncbi:MAG: aminoacyl-tRNA hydrolase [Thermoplasmata archaeon M9B2D]|nr:MAG: aminoacyl-tRNA hydrolase [Thermoplasmata archaeon M9B2D]
MIPQKKNQRDSDYKMVLVTRSDLPLSAGKLAAQVSHAAVACAFLTKKNKPDWFVKWQREGAKKVVVNVETLADFFPLEEQAEKLGIMTMIVTDAGHTEIAEGTQTVLGLGPAPSSLIDQVTGELPLL